MKVADCASSGAKRWKVDDKGTLRFEDGRTFCLVGAEACGSMPYLAP